jgi:hypothetical protein
VARHLNFTLVCVGFYRKDVALASRDLRSWLAVGEELSNLLRTLMPRGRHQLRAVAPGELRRE